MKTNQNYLTENNVKISTSKINYERLRSFGQFSKAELQAMKSTLVKIIKSKEFSVAAKAMQTFTLHELRDLTEHFDLNYPSIWAGDKSRGWGKSVSASEYKQPEGFDDRVVVHFPKRYEAQMQPLKGVWFGKCVASFTTKEKWGECHHFVLVPSKNGKGFAIVDVGRKDCNYGQDLKEVPSPMPVYIPSPHSPECNSHYCPMVVSSIGYDFTKEHSFLEQ